MLTPGTLIATDRGQRPVEALARGDLVVTRAHGLRRIAWIGRRDFGYADLTAGDDLVPVLIRRGALGADDPSCDMIVSQHHRFVLRRATATNGAGTLVSAHELMGRRDVQAATMLGVSYIHLMCRAREVILANGTWMECFHPDDDASDALAVQQRREVLGLFPEIVTMGAARRHVRPRRPVRSRFDV